jgi:hypothetical protein
MATDKADEIPARTIKAKVSINILGRSIKMLINFITN